MAARTRAKASGRKSKSPVKAVGHRRSGQSAYGTLHDLLIRRESIGVVLILLALLAVPWLVPFTAGLADARNRFVETFGLLIFAWIALLLYAGWLVIRDEQPTLWRDWKPAAIALLAGIFLIGFFGFFKPGWNLGDVSMSSHSAGGDLGQRLAGNPIGVLVWLVAGIGAFSLAFPQMASAAVQNSPDAARRVWGWQIPQRSARNARKGFEFIFPTRPAPKGSVKPTSEK